ncbi:hypothetical protein TNCV_503111 [Trichonephila clavipes]|nr:hypothetical protein TNCV_503111 [Trichonephila clavipes]
MVPAYNKKRCAAFPFETGIHFRRKTDFFPEEKIQPSLTRDSNPKPTRLQAEGHSHHTGWATVNLLNSLISSVMGGRGSDTLRLLAALGHYVKVGPICDFFSRQ